MQDLQLYTPPHIPLNIRANTYKIFLRTYVISLLYTEKLSTNLCLKFAQSGTESDWNFFLFSELFVV